MTRSARPSSSDAPTAATTPLLCRLFGHKTKQGNERRGMTETEPKNERGVTRTWSYLWCFRCERYIPGSVQIPTFRRFP